MAMLDALTVSISVLAAIAVYLFLGPLGGQIQIWAAFIAWGCFYHCGGKMTGLRNTVTGTLFGVVVGWVTLYVIVAIPLGGTLGVPLWAAIVVGVFVAALVAAARVPAFAVIPAGVYGFAAIVAYTLLGGHLSPAGLVGGGLANPAISVGLGLVIGALFGFVSEFIGGKLAASAG